MGILAENNQFYKGRKDIIDEFSAQSNALLSVTAGRNFLRLPGYLHEASISLEAFAKNKLSALNYQVVTDAIQRELTQTGHIFTQTYKEERIAFELEKQTVLAALQNEFADVDVMQNLAEEELARLFVELDVRRILLITTKTSIELQMEALRQELAEIDRSTFYNEALLIDERVVTATAKLAVIPHINALIEAQVRVLAAEENNIQYINSLIAEKELLAAKKEEVVPYYVRKAEASTALAVATTEAMVVTESRLALAVERAALRSIAVSGALDVLTAEKAVEELRAELSAARASLTVTKTDRQLAVSGRRTVDNNELAVEHKELTTALAGYRVAIASGMRSAKSSMATIDILADEAVVDTSVDADVAATKYVATYGAAATKETAMAAATARITSQLIHLIGS